MLSLCVLTFIRNSIIFQIWHHWSVPNIVWSYSNVNPMKCGNCSHKISVIHRTELENVWNEYFCVYSELFSTTTGLKGFNNKSMHCINKADCCTLALTFLLSPPLSDSSSRGLSDGGVWGCLQSQGAEGGSSGWDGAMGWHPHSPPCAGTQPQDLGFSQRAARVGSDLTYSSLILLFWARRQNCCSLWTVLSLAWWWIIFYFYESANH